MMFQPRSNQPSRPLRSALPNGFWRVLLARVALIIGVWVSAGAAETISFRNDIMAVLSKAGCNAGPCHGNANGKGGFKLSLRGESPDLDFSALTHDQSARRINPLEPADSLLLLKPTTQLSHEGGQRFKKDSWEYQALWHWIAQGATNDLAAAPALQNLAVSPVEAVLIEPEQTIQIKARATFADGTSRDVSARAVYESANPIVKISEGGLVESSQAGETTVLVRYLHLQVPVRLAFVPARPHFQWEAPEPRNEIDHHIFAKLQRLRMNLSAPAGDPAFVRRAYLDLLGIIPTASEARAFVLDPSPTKRPALIDRLLARPEFADYWALKWSDLLRAEERILDRKGLEAFHRWVRQSLLEHKPLDQFAREIIAARGSTYRNPAANFYRATRTPMERAEASAQLFLGTRVQCAQCHNHPFDRWSQDDYYDWQALFARVKYKVIENRRQDNVDGHEFKGEQIVYLAPSGSIQNPRTGAPAQPRFLGESKQYEDPAVDELTALAAWVTRPENPFFARVQANRVWYHLFGRGLVEPLDDFRASNPASHPELLEALARSLVDHGYDLRQLIRTIMNSRTYQTASEPNETNRGDEANFSHAQLRRLAAEPLLDSQNQVLGTAIRFPGYPLGTRAVQLAGALSERRRGEARGEADQFLASFGKPPRLLPSECERSCDPTMGQAFQLMNGPVLNELLQRPANRLQTLLDSGRPDPELIDELYWWALSRPASPEERKQLGEHLSPPRDRRAAFEDIAWALLNSKEFLFR